VEKIERSSFFKSFNLQFEKQLAGTNLTYQQAFEAASNFFNETIGGTPYKSWESFKSVRSKRRKNRAVSRKNGDTPLL
jgi:hypothetical protein